jgi:hypothetical protein
MAAVAVGAAVSLGTAYMAKKQGDKQAKLAQKGIEASDPFAKYRPEYGEKLQSLMNDPSSIVNTPEYKARQEAAARAMSAQGYTGSGNAIIEAAEAGGKSFQQAYENLSNLAGVGATPGAGYGQALQSQENAQSQQLSAYQGVGNNLVTLAERYGNRGGGGGQTFNAPTVNIPMKTIDPVIKFKGE